MAKNGKSTASKGRKKRAPFVERFGKRIEKLKEWAVKTQPKFATAPETDVADYLEALSTTADSIAKALPALKSWSPPTTRQAFKVGDSVAFKKAKVDELAKAGFYKKGDLEGLHEIEAVNGRKVKLPLGVFQSLYLTKTASASAN
jgi:hypothetical protein